MATRSLTTSFITIRNALRAGSRDKDWSSARTDAGSTSEEMPLKERRLSTDNLSSTPTWIEIMDHIKDVHDAIKAKMGNLKELHATRLRPSFGKDESKEDRIIDALTIDINKLFKEGERGIRNLVDYEGDISRKTPDEQKLLQNVKLSLVTQMNNLSKAFQDEQRKFLTDMHRQKARAEKFTSFGKTTVDEEMEKQEQLVMQYMDKGFTAEQIDALMLNRQMIQQRDAELQKIYSSIVDLHEIFKDLNQLVLDQGTLLDRIDYNVEETKRQITSSIPHLQKVQEYQKKSRYLLFVLLLMALIIAMTFALVIKIVV